jgi:YD repeat-containing protein
MKTYVSLLLALVLFGSFTLAQTDTLTNPTIIEMAKAALSDEIILAAIGGSNTDFDVSPKALLELKYAGVSNTVILQMIEKHDEKAAETKAFSESGDTSEPPASKAFTPKQLLSKARTIALEKSSAQPSRQALEKELLRRSDWKALNLSIHRYKDSADLYVEIGYVSMSWITHRYVYRIYDRRTGTVLAAGETTSWGSLAENLAKHIAKSLATVAKS